jgi:dihydrofolate reductase
VTTRKTRIERDFDLDAIRALKCEAERDSIIGGAELAGLAIDAGLVDECHLFVHPVVLGGGKPAFRAGLRRNLELLDTRRFRTGVIHAHYRFAALPYFSSR